MKIVPNLGIKIKHALEKRDRYPKPPVRQDFYWQKKAKQDFEDYKGLDEK
jgi:hypothetical protein